MLRIVAYLVLAVFGCLAPHARAQSAADKATARKLATEGIQLFQEGKYPEALDKLQRAEAMYDAPVHLLYIARTQVKLNKLVEATENYRRLVRVTLEPNAPPVFRDAVDAGKKELEALEPTVPALRVDVEPQNVQGLELNVGGEKVSAAAVGVERPVNPGKLTVVATAPGYKPAQTEIEVRPGAREAVRLQLEVDPNAAPVTTTPVTGPGTPVTGGPEAKPPEKRKPFGVFVGLRLAGAIPAGTAFELNNQTISTSDLFQAGGGAELHGGVRFARYFAAKLFFEGYSFKPGSKLDEVPAYAVETGRVDVTNTTTSTAFGVGLMAGKIERGSFGAFGEIGFLSQSFHITQTFEDVDRFGKPVCGNGKTSDEFNLSGAAFRIGGGANIPLASFLHLTPYILAEFGSFSSWEFKSGCAQRTGLGGTKTIDGEFDEPTGHQLFMLGVGGDFIFGGP